MFASRMITPAPGDYGPNVGTEDENFFQSDRDIELSAARKVKRDALATLGNPVLMNSKTLHFQLVFDARDRFVYTAQSGHVAQKVNLRTGQIELVFRGHKGPVTHVCLYKHNSALLLLTASWDKTIKKWDTETGECLATFKGHDDFVKSISVFGSKLYSASTDRIIAEWDLVTCELLRTFQGHRRSVEDITLSFDGRVLLSASSDNTIRKWDVATGSELEILEGHSTSIRRILMPDEDCLWTVSADKTACRWDLEV